jgi:ATP-dependent Clp protease ATP-binding subunit ClpC
LVTDQAIARVLAAKVGIPLERLMQGVGRSFSALEEFLSERIVGHIDAIRRVSETVKRGFAGFAGTRPLASFLWVGSPGVGTGELARALAEFLFNSPDAMLTFEMAEFTEKHSIGKLIGTAPGYVGHEEGGRLTEGMYRRPFQILLFRDVAVAHPDVQEIIAQLLSTGDLTDGKGRWVYFSNAIVVLTGNLESVRMSGGEGVRVGFTAGHGSQVGSDEGILKEARKGMVDTLYEGPDERLVFRPLSRVEVFEVVSREVARASRRLKEERNITFELAEKAMAQCIESGG